MAIIVIKGVIQMSTNRKLKSYSFELKLDAVKRIQAGESVKIVANQLEVLNPDYIYEWIKKYNTYGEVGLKRKKRNSQLSDKDKIKELEMENEILKKYLQILKEEEKKQSLK